jgi:hypothetical protein
MLYDRTREVLYTQITHPATPLAGSAQYSLSFRAASWSTLQAQAHRQRARCLPKLISGHQ